ncbi:MAG: hypothetical protein QOI54_2636 [Actinomycetota bacterium]|jgi:hypothetical protein|nr:hypothetical protein [Actinomycetota bacterium]
MSGRATWLGVFGFVGVVFVLTSHWWTGQNADGVAAAWPAWQLVHHGMFDLSGLPGLPPDHWFVRAGDALVSNRTPGVILAGVPANLLLFWTHLAPEKLAAWTAALFSAGAVANIAVLLRGLVSPRLAIAASGVLAFGTAMWTVASAELWTHGPDAFWLSLGLLFVSRRRYALSGLAMAPLVLTRPHLAVVIAVLGIWEAVIRRSLRPCLAMGAPAALAMVALLLWNRWMFHAASIGGGYTYAADNATRSPWTGMEQFGENVAGALVSGWCGVLLYSPVLLALACALPAGWREAPSWARAALVGGLAYQVVQFRINGFNGGGEFYGNRLVLELFVLATPVLTVGYGRWSAGRPRRVVVTTMLAALSVAIYGTGALLADYWVGGTFSDWTTWYPQRVVQAAGFSGLLLAGCALSAVLLTSVASVRSRGWASAPATGPAGR